MTGSNDRKQQIKNPTKYALWRERGQEASHLLAPAVRPIFAFNEVGMPERVGSCVLFSAAGLYFAFSAAHVADLGKLTRLLLGGRLRRVYLPTSWWATPIPAGKDREADKIDAAIFTLSPEIVQGLPTCEFLELGDCNIGGYCDDEATWPHYLCIGYRLKQGKFDEDHTRVAFDFTTCHGPEVSKSKYYDLHRPKATYLCLDFNLAANVNAVGRIDTAPKLRGMSGGAIVRWHSWDDRVAPGPGRDRLEAIFTDFLKHGVIIGTRVAVFVEKIRREHPAVANQVPPLNIEPATWEYVTGSDARRRLR
ncbi:MAG TPA: hypothetical protein VNV25_22400 [Gemmatimonadaceae bacterium]|jgi:hypothetical protein|nr:hypothetical protein [Gemmatimonadaceae bacterium]